MRSAQLTPHVCTHTEIRPVSQSSVTQTVSQPSQSVQPVSQPAARSVSRSVIQPASQPVSQTVSQSVSEVTSDKIMPGEARSCQITSVTPSATPPGSQRGRQADRHAHMQTDRQTGRRTGREADSTNVRKRTPATYTHRDTHIFTTCDIAVHIYIYIYTRTSVSCTIVHSWRRSASRHDPPCAHHACMCFQNTPGVCGSDA